MDQHPAPWRVLEDPTPAASNGSDGVETRAETSSLAIPRWVVVSGVAAALLIVGAFLIAAGTSSGSVAVQGGAPLTSSGPGAVSSGDAATTPASGRILVVEIVGAVSRPGVFRLPAGSRVGDLVGCGGWLRTARRRRPGRPRAEPGRAADGRRPHPRPVEGRCRRSDDCTGERRGLRFGRRERRGGRPQSGRTDRPQPGDRRAARHAARDRSGHGGQDPRVAGRAAIRVGR